MFSRMNKQTFWNYVGMPIRKRQWHTIKANSLRDNLPDLDGSFRILGKETVHYLCGRILHQHDKNDKSDYPDILLWSKSQIKLLSSATTKKTKQWGMFLWQAVHMGTENDLVVPLFYCWMTHQRGLSYHMSEFFLLIHDPIVCSNQGTATYQIKIFPALKSHMKPTKAKTSHRLNGT